MPANSFVAIRPLEVKLENAERLRALCVRCASYNTFRMGGN
jgi:hypothetical protein